MKRLAFLILVLIFSSRMVNAQIAVDTLDLGVVDTISAQPSGEVVVRDGTASFVIDLSLWSDSGIAASMAVGLIWNRESGAILDSAKVSVQARTGFDFIQEVYRNRNRDSTNLYGQFLFFGVRIGVGLKPTGSFQTLAKYYFHVPKWSKFSEFVVDTLKFSPGTAYGLMTYTSLPEVSYHRYPPRWSGPLVIHDPNRPCCVNIMGNIDGQDGIDIGDQTLLIDHLFGSGVALSCVDAANVDGSADGSVDMADLIALTEHLFMGGQLAECK